MKYAHIVPNELLSISENVNDMHLVLLHWLGRCATYRKFFSQDLKKPIILDNSFYEAGKTFPIRKILDWAVTINAQEVIAPDIMFDYEKTKYAVMEFLKTLPEYKKSYGYEPMINTVVCGKDKKDFRECFHWMNNHPQIDVISISRRGVPYPSSQHDVNRRLFIKEIDDVVKKPIHLLGANGISDYFVYWGKHVRSIDSKQIAKTVLMRPFDEYLNDTVSTRERLDFVELVRRLRKTSAKRTKSRGIGRWHKK